MSFPELPKHDPFAGLSPLQKLRKDIELRNSFRLAKIWEAARLRASLEALPDVPDLAQGKLLPERLREFRAAAEFTRDDAEVIAKRLKKAKLPATKIKTWKPPQFNYKQKKQIGAIQRFLKKAVEEGLITKDLELIDNVMDAADLPPNYLDMLADLEAEKMGGFVDEAATATKEVLQDIRGSELSVRASEYQGMFPGTSREQAVEYVREVMEEEAATAKKYQAERAKLKKEMASKPQRRMRSAGYREKLKAALDAGDHEGAFRMAQSFRASDHPSLNSVVMADDLPSSSQHRKIIEYFERRVSTEHYDEMSKVQPKAKGWAGVEPFSSASYGAPEKRTHGRSFRMRGFLPKPVKELGLDALPDEVLTMTSSPVKELDQVLETPKSAHKFRRRVVWHLKQGGSFNLFGKTFDLETLRKLPKEELDDLRLFFSGQGLRHMQPEKLAELGLEMGLWSDRSDPLTDSERLGLRRHRLTDSPLKVRQIGVSLQGPGGQYTPDEWGRILKETAEDVSEQDILTYGISDEDLYDEVFEDFEKDGGHVAERRMKEDPKAKSRTAGARRKRVSAANRDRELWTTRGERLKLSEMETGQRRAYVKRLYRHYEKAGKSNPAAFRQAFRPMTTGELFAYNLRDFYITKRGYDPKDVKTYLQILNEIKFEHGNLGLDFTKFEHKKFIPSAKVIGEKQRRMLLAKYREGLGLTPQAHMSRVNRLARIGQMLEGVPNLDRLQIHDITDLPSRELNQLEKALKRTPRANKGPAAVSFLKQARKAGRIPRMIPKSLPGLGLAALTMLPLLAAASAAED